MKKELLKLGLVAGIATSSLFGFTYEIKQGWQQLGAIKDFDDLKPFDDASCVEYLWHYDLDEPEDKDKWKLHISDGKNYNYCGKTFSSLDKGDGFWLKASGECNITVTEPDNCNSSGFPTPPSLDGSTCDLNITYSSCKAILDAGKSTGNGIYTIDPDGNGVIEPFEAYCDMTTDGGGWTLIARTNSNFTKEVESINMNTPLGSKSVLEKAKRDVIIQNSTKIFRASNNANSLKLYIYDEAPTFLLGANAWNSEKEEGKCSKVFNTDINNSVWKSLPKINGSTAFGNHIGGSANGWILWHLSDPYNVSGAHPCSFGTGTKPTGAALNNIFIK